MTTRPRTRNAATLEELYRENDDGNSTTDNASDDAEISPCAKNMWLRYAASVQNEL